MFSLEDGRKHFFQWDVDRRLIVDDPEVTQVHFCNRTSDCSLVVEVYEEDGKRLADVPNVLLRTAWRIAVFAYNKDYTKTTEFFEVQERTKPDSYVYTETEVLSYNSLAERIEALEEGGTGSSVDLSGYALKTDIPTALPNPNNLVVTSLFEQRRYDGSNEVEITIPEKIMLGLMQGEDGSWQLATLDGGQALTLEAFGMLFENGAIIEVINAQTGELYDFDRINTETGEVIFARQDGVTRKEAVLHSDNSVTVTEISGDFCTEDQVQALIDAAISEITDGEAVSY